MNNERPSPISPGSDTLNTRLVELGLELLARDGERKAAAFMAAAGVRFNVIVRVISEPKLRRRNARIRGERPL